MYVQRVIDIKDGVHHRATSYADNVEQGLEWVRRPDLRSKNVGEFLFSANYLKTSQHNVLSVFNESYGSTVHIDVVPSQCGMVCLHNWELEYDEEKQDANELLLEYALSIAKAFGYTAVMATLIFREKVEWLEGHGFQDVHQFRNFRSGNVVHTLIKTLEYADYANGV